MVRNKELRQLALACAVIAALSAVGGFALHPAAGFLSLVSSAALGGVFLGFTRARYRRIAQLAEEVDRVLHNADTLSIQDAEEGELSILHSELTKMTLRLREQNAALRREKRHLADALADIAHQLRTPLTAANLTLSLLKTTKEPQERRTLLRETQVLFRQMDWLLNTLLKQSRLDADMVVFQRAPVAVDDLVRAALRPFLLSFELHSITLETDLSPGATWMGDRHWLTEALQNLLKNALDHVSLTIAKGEFTAIIGSSGSGKSTLLHIIAGVDIPTSGTVFLNGQDVYAQNRQQLAIFRRRQVGMIYQFHNLIPTLNVVENITLPILMDHRKVNQERLEELLTLLGLQDRRGHLPNQLSGGQQQRVAIGRALMNSPAVMLADEPTGSLDSQNSQEILRLLKESHRKYHQTLLLVTHDASIALQADRILTIADGRVVRDERRVVRP